MSKKTRSYVFTLNNYTEEQVEMIKMWECKHVGFAKEVAPTTGTRHLQGMVQWENAVTIRGLVKRFPWISFWAVREATAEAARDYCKKGEQPKEEWDQYKVLGPNYGKNVDYWEKGDLPMTDFEKGIAEKRRWADAYTAVEENRLDDVPKDILCSRLKSIQYAVEQVRVSKRKLETLDGSLEHEWWYGPTGTGKSKKAREENPGAYIKDPKNAWWDGYKGEDVVIIDDFDKFQVKQSGDLKRWLDRYVFKAEVKGGYVGDIRPKKIIITSNYHPKEIWEETDITLSTILRRVHVTHFSVLGTGATAPEPASPNRFTSLPTRFN